jgi:hypothetical protein
MHTTMIRTPAASCVSVQAWSEDGAVSCTGCRMKELGGLSIVYEVPAYHDGGDGYGQYCGKGR